VLDQNCANKLFNLETSIAVSVSDAEFVKDAAEGTDANNYCDREVVLHPKGFHLTSLRAFLRRANVERPRADPVRAPVLLTPRYARSRKMNVTHAAKAGAPRMPPAEKQNVKFEPFQLRAQLLCQGRTDTVVARSDTMQLRLKVYASGGENGLHTHAKEDHTFLVLQGRARFYDKDDNATDVGRNGGVFIPAGAYYRFEAISAEELVLFRVGAKIGAEKDGPSRLNIHGRPMDGHSQENKEVPVIYKDNAFFE
jgi:mannose-6-phosphate isomerase-like protein (cupin superfamily)